MQIKAIAIALTLALSTFCSAPAVSAQGSGSLIEVLQTAAASEFNGTVQISEEESPRARKGDFRAFGKIGGAMTGPALFKDSLQVNLSENAMSACTSSSSLPKIKIYGEGDKRLYSVTASEETISFAATANAIMKAADFKALLKEVESAGEIEEKDADGGLQYRVKLGADYMKPKNRIVQPPIRGRVNPRGMPAEAILNGLLIATMDAGGELKTLAIETQYNDPMGGIIKKAMKNGGAAKQIVGRDDFEKSDVPGRKMIVTFTLTDDENDEAKAFAEEAAKLLSEAKEK